MLARAQARMSTMQPHACPQDQAAAPAAPEAVRPRLKSVVVASETYDSRSLAQIKREIKEAELKKKASATASKEAKAQAAQVQNLTDVRNTPLVGKADNQDDEEEVEDSEAYHEDEEEGDDTAVDDQLLAAMGGLGIRPAGSKPEALRGVPLPQGTHIRFDDDGTAMDSPTSGKPALRGLPQATGAHIRFD
ncbi:hypothetical protein DUNSADRAFT_13342 [Dunaliella salina]|uniref:Uncharacterized protein n=1 Tax=Dunaliella salina TaxID=3046 RepID=A0ABQ7G9K7_DUNSA|nr:hypothetical protein DUNSADRAFT_13342 [Dunaliella salina]|eukprot:KAF5831286.1 hypothetical protein DUNSADRAFT_13342 [Dunaliella salina]